MPVFLDSEESQGDVGPYFQKGHGYGAAHELMDVCLNRRVTSDKGGRWTTMKRRDCSNYCSACSCNNRDSLKKPVNSPQTRRVQVHSIPSSSPRVIIRPSLVWPLVYWLSGARTHRCCTERRRRGFLVARCWAVAPASATRLVRSVGRRAARRDSLGICSARRHTYRRHPKSTPRVSRDWC